MKSIRLRLWTSMMILILVVILLLWFFQIVFLERFYTDIKISQVKRRGYEVISHIENLEDPEMENIIDEFSYNNNLNIQVINTNKEYIYESTSSTSLNNKNQRNTGRGHINNIEFQDIMKNKEIIKSYNHFKFGNEIVIIGLPIVFEDENVGALFINFPLTSVKDTIDILKKQLLYITIILLIVSTIISFLLARVFTKPILEIQKVTKKIANQDFSKRVNIKRKDEIGGLADSINDMAVELSKIEDLRKDLIANVSHELRTPLSLIQGYAEVIKDVSGENKEKRQEHLNIIINESQRLSIVVDDILNLSQIQSGYVKINKNKTSINNLIYNVVKTYDVLSKETGISIETKLDSDIELMIDKIKIEQVFYNLINNAFNYTGSGGTILVSTSLNNEDIKIIIKDNGSGIEQKELRYIWDRYYKDNITSKRGNIGTGLGLSIVKTILERHDADYSVESEVGVGTIFSFKLKRK